VKGPERDGSNEHLYVSRRELRHLKWLTALVPGAVVLIYETARQETLGHLLPALPVQYGNFIVWVLVLVLTYAFSAFSFSEEPGGRPRREITDNGHGFNPEAPPGRKSFSLESMRERVQSLGGELTIDSQRGQGTSVIVTVPKSSGGARKRHALTSLAR
jgi:hypothetical protein